MTTPFKYLGRRMTEQEVQDRYNAVMREAADMKANQNSCRGRFKGGRRKNTFTAWVKARADKAAK